MDPLLRRLRRLAVSADPDGRLLARYAATGDGAAVEELVRRHGPLVWAAARRRLPDPADAADVFQATFLVLLQKGGRLSGSPTVGPWLYRVAALTARNLRRKNARRLARRRPLLDVPAPPAFEWRADLDAALLALPERDRAAVVLCHLQGYSRAEAAERLGVPAGTLSSVLNRALAKLRRRLGDDPLPLLAAGSLAVPAGVATAAVEAAAVVRAASLAAAGVEVATLTREAMRMFWLKKLAAGGMAVAACLGLGVGVGLAPRPAAVAAEPPKVERLELPPPAVPPAAPVEPPDEGKVSQLRQRAAEAEARAKELATVLAREEERLRAHRAKQANEKKSPRIRLVVSAENRPWDAFVRVEETDAAGNLIADYGCGGGKLGEVSLATHLRRAKLDPAGPREVVMEVSPKFDPFDLGVIAQAVTDAGFPTVTYTGSLPESWTLGKNQDGKPARSWTGHKLVKGERVELTKVLPLDPPASEQPRCYVIWEGKDRKGEVVFAVQLDRAQSVLDVVATAVGLPVEGTANIYVIRKLSDQTERTLPVDWEGIMKNGITATNYQLMPGDRVYIKRPMP